MKYYSKGSEVEATKWCKNGDHPLDYSKTHPGMKDGFYYEYTPVERKAAGWEGDIVKYFRHPDVDGSHICQSCGKIMDEHGWIDQGMRGETVCPGDFIIQSDDGHFYPCKPEVFKALFNH